MNIVELKALSNKPENEVRVGDYVSIPRDEGGYDLYKIYKKQKMENMK